MKIWKTLALSSLIFSVSCWSEEQTEEDIFSDLVECIINVTEDESNIHKIQSTDSVALFNSVLQNLAFEAGEIVELDSDYSILYPIAYKHCPTQIDNVKSLEGQKS